MDPICEVCDEADSVTILDGKAVCDDCYVITRIKRRELDAEQRWAETQIALFPNWKKEIIAI